MVEGPDLVHQRMVSNSQASGVLLSSSNININININSNSSSNSNTS